jgi:hypothetical protein
MAKGHSTYFCRIYLKSFLLLSLLIIALKNIIKYGFIVVVNTYILNSKRACY